MRRHNLFVQKTDKTGEDEEILKWNDVKARHTVRNDGTI